ADNFKELKEVLNNPKSIVSTVLGLVEENTRLKKEVEKGLFEKLKTIKSLLVDQVETIEGVNFIAQKVDVPTADALKNLSFSLKDSIDNLFLVLGATVNGKPTLSVMVSESLIADKQLNAVNIIRELAKDIQGGGGGQPFYATAGGKNVEGLAQALEKARQFIK
ncbi:MAG TPA: DHHA1 domain-containing protein, partial [Sphingobacteriaceae bacterium]|nr:DHHA1 domain-containing protein [Sphingobacteriaceae bacterium]